MSNDAINWVLGNRRNEPGLRGPKNAQRLVLLVLANYASDDGEAYPGIDTIAHEANVSKGTAQDALSWLIINRYIDREVKAGPPKRGQNQPRNLYRLNWDVEKRGQNPPPPADDAEGADSPTQRGRISPVEGVDFPSDATPTPYSLEPNGTQGEPAQRTHAAPAQLALVGTPERTVNQIANEMQKRFWAYVETRVGRPPVSVNPVGFQRLMASFLNAGVPRGTLGQAVERLWGQGRPVTKATIEAEIDGRCLKRQARQTVDEQLDAAGLRYDAAGNLVV